MRNDLRDDLPAIPRGPYAFSGGVSPDYKTTQGAVWQHEDDDHRWINTDEKGGANRASTTIPADKTLHPGTIIEALNVARGVKVGEAGDGDTVLFNPAFSRTPVVIFGMGGMTYASSIAGDQCVSVRALNLSASGFTLSAKIQPATATLTARSASFVGDTATKSEALEAYDQKYRFNYSVTVDRAGTSSGGFASPSSVTLVFWTNDGSGWVSRAARNYSNPEAAPVLIPDYLDLVVAGMEAGDQFRITVESTAGFGGSVSRTSVTWQEGSTPAGSSMTPAGSTLIPFTAISGT